MRLRKPDAEGVPPRGLPRPVIYLDIDGVLNIVRLRLTHITRDTGFSGFQVKRHGRHTLRRSSEVRDRLSALHERADIIWVSLSDIDRSVLGVPADGSFTIANNGLGHSGKLDSILADQQANPRPFAWVDDEECRYLDLAAAAGELPQLAPHLTVRPRTDRGITVTEMERIEAFITRHTGAP